MEGSQEEVQKGEVARSESALARLSLAYLHNLAVMMQKVAGR